MLAFRLWTGLDLEKGTLTVSTYDEKEKSRGSNEEEFDNS